MGTTKFKFKLNLVLALLCSTLPGFTSAATLASRQGNTSCGAGPFTLECCLALGSASDSTVAQALASIGITSVPGGMVGFQCTPGICAPGFGDGASVCCSNVQSVAQFGIALGCDVLNR